GASLRVSGLVPRMNVGVAPSTLALLGRVTLCSSGALFVKEIVTVPALALSCLVSKPSSPWGLAASFSEVAAAGAGAGAEAAVVGGVGDACVEGCFEGGGTLGVGALAALVCVVAVSAPAFVSEPEVITAVKTVPSTSTAEIAITARS